MFDTIELWCTTDDMFLLFDYVHLIKNVQNNWITESYQKLVFHADGKRKQQKGLILKHCTILLQIKL